jgi:EAL domain-containing protein (putative c-di-GMP-specific phosphodiesterase class I)
MMTRVVGLTVLAEGVENEDQLKVLRELDCDFVQGFLFSPAVQADQFEKLMSEAFSVEGSDGSPQEAAG